jgi:hypothetical protein
VQTALEFKGDVISWFCLPLAVLLLDGSEYPILATISIFQILMNLTITNMTSKTGVRTAMY